MLPSEVIVGPHRVPIVYKDRLGDDDACVVDGLFVPDDFHIEIRSGLRGSRTAEVLLHEALHALNTSVAFASEEDEERVVTTLASSLTKLAQDNPNFIRAWLAHATAG